MVMEEVRKLLRLHTQAHRAILEYFGTEGYDTIEDATTVRWSECDREIHCIDDDNTEFVWEYCKKLCIRDNAVLYYCRDNGDKFYAIFDLNNKVDEV